MAASPLLASTPGGLDALREYNLVVFKDLDSISEVEGRPFVGGDLNGSSSNYNIGNAPASTNGSPQTVNVGGSIATPTSTRTPSIAVLPHRTRSFWST
ncbi:hypothetical protein A9995_03015 [Erythrobacter sp. QSSC1-22B]|nr:hypothetical protein A9995_03015 [Erythrobacter sp. QSSC1-22B]